LATVTVVILGILWIPVMKSIGEVLYTYLQDVQSVLAPGIAAAFLMGVISRKPTPLGGLWGMIVGFIIGITRLFSKVYYTQQASKLGYSDVSSWALATGTDGWFYMLFYDVNWLFFSGGMLVVCILVILGVSYFTVPASEEQIEGLTFGSATPEQKEVTRKSWGTWDLVHSGIILVFTLLFYAYFW